MSNVRFRAVGAKLLSTVAALALVLCMAPSAAIAAPAQAQSAQVQATDVATAEQSLAARFMTGGSNSSIDNNTWGAVFALQALGKRDKIDAVAISANKDAAASGDWGISGGTLAKYILALEAAGADCSGLYAQMESLASSEFASDYWVYSAVCILPVYSAYGRGALSENATYSAGDLAVYVAESLAVDPYMDNQTRAQGLLALAPYAGLPLSDAKAFGFEDDAELYESFQGNVDAIAQKVYDAYDAASGAFTDVIDWETYTVGPNVDTTAWCAAALCVYGWGSLNPSDTAAYLSSVVSEDGTVDAPGVYDEAMSASAALMGLAAIDAFADAGEPVNVYACAPAPSAPQGTWKKDSKGWWYDNGDGSYPKSCWKQVDGEWYHFNSSGYMQTGWQKLGGKWYYMNGSGAMQTGWQKISGKWYYMNVPNGDMATGWVKVGGTWYCMSGSGAMQTGWVKSGGKWYYMSGSGAMQTGWLKLSGKWYYLSGSGAMVTGTQKIGGKTYRFNSSGVLVS